MAWYEAHQTMAKHPKTLKLARLLKVDRRYAVGLLHDLFSWALDNAGKEGQLYGMTEEDIAAALDISGKKGVLTVEALVESGYLELWPGGVWAIHDWYDYAGKLMDRRESDKDRKAKIRDERRRKSEACPQDIQRTSTGNPYATVPYRTVPNQSSNMSNTIPTPTTSNAQGDKSAAVAAVMTAYLDKINATPSQMSLDELKGYAESMGAAVCLRAFDIALDRKKADWYYIKGILQRVKSQGVTCLADWDALEERREKEKSKTPQAGNPNAENKRAREDMERMRRLMDKMEEENSDG